ncbi:cytochrome P450 [Thozetella sp. PMI_491]|nr:cytochrome P450 [Thozetella sp. PMI_491]
MDLITGQNFGLGIWVACLWCAGGFIAWSVASTFWSWYRLRHIPGPRLGSISHLWIGYHILSGNSINAFRGLKVYGSLVRVGPNYLVTDDPDVLRKMAAARTKYRRDDWFSAIKFDPKMDNMISLLDTAEHDTLKAKVARGYSGRENPDLEASVDSELIRLVDLIRRKYVSVGDNSPRFDFAMISRCFTMDVITRLGYGKAFGHLDEGTDVYGFIAQIDQLLAFLATSADIPWIRRFMFSALGLRLFGPKPTDAKGIGKIIGVTKRLIEERFEKGADVRNDMFGSFIQHGLTKRELEGESVLQILAGSDTTASAIRGIMLHILATPVVYHRLKAEIKDAVEQNKASSPITYNEAQKLPYLQAVIWEGFRMKCPVVYGHFKVVPPEGDTINGLFVPGGTAIGHNSVALTHSQAIFGRDVEVFRPERFLECSEEKKHEMDRAIDITFGGGRWMCAGKSIAHLELNKIFFELLRAFDFQLVNAVTPCKEAGYVVSTHTDMWVRVTEGKV